MFNKLRPVWLVAQRELRDKFRDWRVLAPMSILTLGFPFLMNEFAKQTVDFLNQYNANLILDRLVPFSIMIIGFFPITVALVVALESFVGEKERGTILATPLSAVCPLSRSAPYGNFSLPELQQGAGCRPSNLHGCARFQPIYPALSRRSLRCTG